MLLQKAKSFLFHLLIQLWNRSEQLQNSCICKHKILLLSYLGNTQWMHGPWRWTSGQCTCLLLRRSEVESHWSLQFNSVNYLKRTKINKKRHILKSDSIMSRVSVSGLRTHSLVVVLQCTNHSPKGLNFPKFTCLHINDLFNLTLRKYSYKCIFYSAPWWYNSQWTTTSFDLPPEGSA